MATHNTTLSLSITAGQDLSAQSSRFRAVTINGTILANVAGGAPGNGPIGILNTSARSGEPCSVQYAGIVKAIAGAAVSTLGYPLQASSGGYLFAAVSGGNHVGRALETAASGDLFQALVDFTHVAQWGGA